ncbi:SPOR domain-containing protein [Sphingomonas sp. CLY1604]|uniref:SPOR domain-containing protein n=1 Tax=Sphingomonas sp. CLY1604 TaxID=3457786 RepID=UPI003FD8E3D4
MRTILWVAAGLTIAGAPAVAQTVKAGVDAWSRGDFPAAVAQWRGLAVAGDADAQFNLGQAYKLGRGVPVDPVLAESWFRKAALQGHPQAEDNYGLALFQAGRKSEAAPWLEKAVRRGEPRGQLVLGTMLFNGDGVPRDYPRAYALMTLASQAGLKAASETLAQMDQYVTPVDRERGLGLAQSYAAAAPGASAARGRATLASVPANDAPPPRVVLAQQRPAAGPLARGGPAMVPSPDRPAPARPAPERAEHRPAPPRPQPERAERSGGSWRIQLGAFSTQANASTQWARVRGRIGGAEPAYVKAGSVIRLQAGGFASKAAAQKACAASGVPCVVVAP